MRVEDGRPELGESEQRTRLDFIQGLREMADWYEARPGIPAPTSRDMNLFTYNREDFLALRRASGIEEKISEGDYLVFRKKFGNLTLDINCRKEFTCKRVKVSEEVVPALPERTVTLPAEPEQIKETFEWQCDESLLRAGDQ